MGSKLKKKKILFLVNHDVVIYNFRRELVERLLEEGNEVIISSPYGKRINQLVELGCQYKEIFIERHGTSIRNDYKIIKHYKELMKEVKPDIVLTYTIKPNIYGGIAAKSLKIPYVSNITGLGTAVEHDGILQKITILLYKYAFKKIQRVFFQNIENQQFFIDKGIALKKHGLLPGSGVNLEQFKMLEYPSADTTEFVFISRIMKEKGIDYYLEAAKIIKAKYPHTKFHICGFCEEKYEAILEELHENNVIIYHGMVDDVRKIIAQTHCTIHPTYYPEGMSNVLLESAACARPLITTNRSGCREIVDSEVNGYVVMPKDQNELIEAIEKFIELPHEKKIEMGLNSRSKVENEFDRKIVIDRYLDEIN